MADMFADEDAARFFQMVQMLQRSTLLQMGYLPDQAGQYHYNMAEAREGIEVLRMFQRKTDGNLSAQETQMLRAVIRSCKCSSHKHPNDDGCNRKRKRRATLFEKPSQTSGRPGGGSSTPHGNEEE